MNLIPLPKYMRKNGDTFLFRPSFEITLDTRCGFSEFEIARILKSEVERAVCTAVSINKSSDSPGCGLYINKTESESEDYKLSIRRDKIEISGGEIGVFYGAQTLRQIVRQYGAELPGIMIKDEPEFKNRGFMFDVTRGKVPKRNTLHELADIASFYKLNQLQLYIEHTFAFKDFSEVCMGKDPLYAEDILEFDEYCRNRHIELVPALATFGHLYEVLSTKSFSKYAELKSSDAKPFSFYDRMAHHTLNVSDKDSFNLVKKMIDEFLPLFSSNRFNICCDETFDIGKGKSSALASKCGESRLYVDFLKRIIEYVRGKGKKVMFWSDIILKSPEYIQEIPKDVCGLYWNYSREVPENEIETLSNKGLEFCCCPGVCGWNVMMNIFDGAYENIKSMVNYGCKYGAKGILNTDWGDFGHINFFANSKPGLAFGAGFSWRPTDKRAFDELQRTYFTIEYGENAQPLAELLSGLAENQVGTWADVVCWHEAKYTDNKNAHNDISRVKNMDERKALDGYRRALEIEKKLICYARGDEKSQDIKEFIISAHGVALFNAASLAIKKYDCKCGTCVAEDCGCLAADFENWFASFTELWRCRNKESELYRIRETLVFLCRSLRGWSNL